MRNPAIDALDVLVGEWRLTVSDAWFLESRDVRRHGRDFHQRFVGSVTPDRIDARFEASEDAGVTGRKDFDLTFERESGA